MHDETLHEYLRGIAEYDPADTGNPLWAVQAYREMLVREESLQGYQGMFYDSADPNPKTLPEIMYRFMQAHPELSLNSDLVHGMLSKASDGFTERFNQNFRQPIPPSYTPSKNASTSLYGLCRNMCLISGTLPLTLATGDTKDGLEWAADSVVTVSEFLDSLWAMLYGQGEKPVDGYGKMYCRNDLNQYTESDYHHAVTRAEIAYITVMCWEGFSSVWSASQATGGIKADWTTAESYLPYFADMHGWRLLELYRGIPTYENEGSATMRIISHKLSDYMFADKTVCEHLERMNKLKMLSVPMFMCLVELFKANVLRCVLVASDTVALRPFGTMTRGELAVFLVKLAEYIAKERIRYEKEEEALCNE